MRLYFLIVLILSSFLTVLRSTAFANQFDKQAFMRLGLNQVTESLEDHRKDFGFPSSAACPASGYEVVENLASKRGKIFSAVDSIEDLMDAIKPALQQKLADNRRCGTCQQWNLISRFTSVNPEQTLTVPQCMGLPSETFAMVLQSEGDLKDMTEQILTGKNAEGQRLQRSCPDPCAYYVTTAQTELGNGKKHLTLTVQCGHPRQRSIFSAVYEFKAGLIHQWSCAPFRK